jgi:hypothetical protein
MFIHKFIRPTPRITRASYTYALRLAQSGDTNLNKNLACGVGCMRLLARLFTYNFLISNLPNVVEVDIFQEE